MELLGKREPQILQSVGDATRGLYEQREALIWIGMAELSKRRCRAVALLALKKSTGASLLKASAIVLSKCRRSIRLLDSSGKSAAKFQIAAISFRWDPLHSVQSKAMHDAAGRAVVCRAFHTI